MILGEASRDGDLLERRGAAGGGVAVRGLDHTVGLARGLSRTGNERGERVQSRFGAEQARRRA